MSRQCSYGMNQAKSPEICMFPDIEHQLKPCKMSMMVRGETQSMHARKCPYMSLHSLVCNAMQNLHHIKACCFTLQMCMQASAAFPWGECMPAWWRACILTQSRACPSWHPALLQWRSVMARSEKPLHGNPSLQQPTKQTRHRPCVLRFFKSATVAGLMCLQGNPTSSRFHLASSCEAHLTKAVYCSALPAVPVLCMDMVDCEKTCNLS